MGISYCDSTVPESPLQSLPTMLHINSTASIRSYSKAPGVFSSICRYPASLPDCIFTEQVLETVSHSLRHSCTSELTRQGNTLYIPFSYKINCRHFTIGLYLNHHLKINLNGRSATFGLLLVAFG